MHSQLEYLLASHPDAPVWQSLGWNEMLGYANMQREGWYIGIHREGEVLAYCLLEVRAV
ncbi:MAG TPA: hypothetical protein PK765_00025 [bacterium]|nr:hypothetical protein [bacterium]